MKEVEPAKFVRSLHKYLMQGTKMTPVISIGCEATHGERQTSTVSNTTVYVARNNQT